MGELPGPDRRGVNQCLADNWSTARERQQASPQARRRSGLTAVCQDSAPAAALRTTVDIAAECHAAVVALAETLTARGFTVVYTGEVLCARNPAGDPPEPAEGGPVGVVMSPGLSQSVVCRPDPSERPMFWWVWTGRTSDDQSEDVQPLCPAVEVERAAERVAHVIAVPSEPKARR